MVQRISGTGFYVPGRVQDLPMVRRISIADLFAALRRGLDDFMAAPTQLLFLGILYPIVGAAAAGWASEADLVPMIYPMIAGITLMGPLVAIGIYELSRQREMGRTVSWRNAFDVRHSPALGAVAWLGVLLLALLVAWLAAAEWIYAATMGTAGRLSMPEFLGDLFTTPEGMTLVLVGNGVGFLFALAVLCVSVVSFPFLLDRGGSVWRAIHLSARCVRRNPGPMSAWGLMVALLLLVGCLPLFVGLAFIVPVLGHATWHLYRRMVI